MRSSGPLRLSGYCGGRCWRLAWLRNTGRPRAERRAATVVRAAAARAALPRRRRAPPRAPRRLRGEAHGRPGPAGRRATAAAGRRPGAPVRSCTSVAAVRAVMARRAIARGAPRAFRLPTHHAGMRGRPRPQGPAGPRLSRPRPKVLAGAAGRLQATDRARRPALRHQTVRAGSAGIRPRQGRGPATGLRRRAQGRTVPAPALPPGGAPGPSAAMDRGGQARVQPQEPQEPGEAPAPSEGRGCGRPRAEIGAGRPALDAAPGTGLRRVRPAREAATGLSATRPASARAVAGPEPPGPGPIRPRAALPGVAQPTATARRTRAGHGRAGRGRAGRGRADPASRTRSPLSNSIPRRGRI